MAEKRKLAAILAADVVGFSRLTGADEDRTLARLRALRSDLIDPTIAVHNGRVFKRTGDGALVEFRSVVEAVRCAIEVQNAMVERNAGVAQDRRIEFRIGIHAGDVVEESDGDLMGDGVNIAARLEGIAKPGSICLSEQAYWQVKARLDIAVSDLGPTQLKNIAEPNSSLFAPGRAFRRSEAGRAGRADCGGKAGGTAVPAKQTVNCRTALSEHERARLRLRRAPSTGEVWPLEISGSDSTRRKRPAALALEIRTRCSSWRLAAPAAPHQLPEARTL